MEGQYYTAEEVMKLLGKSRSTFYREVDEGIIPSELEKGRKRGRKFPKEAIDVHIRLKRKGVKAHLTFSPTTNSDLWTGYQNTRRIYEEDDVVSYEKLLEWREANYDIFMTARDGDERAGGITIIPLAESVIQSLIDDKIKERDIPQWSIRKWTDPDLSVFISSISITHTGDKQKDRERGVFIIRNAIRWAFSLEKQYDIKNWYAIAVTPEGKKLVEHLGFEKLKGKRDAYILDNMRKAVKPIRFFLETLEQPMDEVLIPKERNKGKV